MEINNEITSVVIDYKDQGLRIPGPDSCYKTTINKTDKTLSIKHMKDGRDMYWETVLPVSKDKIEKFFKIITETAWEDDYSVMVCDGFEWSMSFKSGTKTIRKIIGTIDPPEAAVELTELIYSMLDDQLCTDYPQLWGYVPLSEE